LDVLRASSCTSNWSGSNDAYWAKRVAKTKINKKKKPINQANPRYLILSMIELIAILYALFVFQMGEEIIIRVMVSEMAR